MPTSRFRNAFPPAPRRAAAGFTLLELVAVIGIIAVMSLVVVGGFNGIIRALSRDTGGKAVQRALVLARQQACVDGQAVYLWVTGMDSFALVRKSGTISDSTTSPRDYFWDNGNKSLSNLGDGRALWVFDSYADLSAAGVDFGIDATYSPDDVRAVFDQYKGMLAFDMTAAKWANVIIPPMYAKEADAWVFGVDKSQAGDAFKSGHDYGWLVLPEQYLPKGYVFEGSYGSDGSFNQDYNHKVRFDATGCADAETTFTVREVSSQDTPVSVKVHANGKIEFVKTK